MVHGFHFIEKYFSICKPLGDPGGGTITHVMYREKSDIAIISVYHCMFRVAFYGLMKHVP